MRAVNSASYLVLCGTTIALFVFLSVTQPFVLTDIFGRLDDLGAIVGTLALVDEIVNAVCAPLWGALSDKVGTRYVAAVGMALLGVGLILCPVQTSVVPGLVMARMVFACGGSACISMVTAILSEHSLYDRSICDPIIAAQDFQFREEVEQEQQELAAAGSSEDCARAIASRPRIKNGKLAGLVGFMSGLGAIFAVLVLVPLSDHFGYAHNAPLALKKSYFTVGGSTLVVAGGLSLTLYQNPAKTLSRWLYGQHISVFDEAALGDATSFSMASYWELVRAGFVAARHNTKLRLSYYGGATARASSVVIALFIPLAVNAWYYKTGRCGLDGSQGCRDGYVRAAILTGVANTATLVAAPFVGWLVDVTRPKVVLLSGSIVGVASMAGFLLVPSPLGFLPIILSIGVGIANIAVLTESMSLCSSQECSFNGSVAGVYSLCGGLGIILITQVGGRLSDVWINAPFCTMLVMYLGVCALSR